MLSLVNQSVKLYRVHSGEPTLVETAENVGFVYGKYNNMHAEVKSVNGEDFITLSINDNTVFDNTSAGNIGADGYFGILSKSVPVEIKTGTYLNLELTSNKKYVDITAFIVENKNHKMITAFYDESGVLVSLEINNVSESGNYRHYVPSKASKIVTYLIDDINNMKPVCSQAEVYK